MPISYILTLVGDKFVFPREENKRFGNNSTSCENEIPSTETIRGILEEAKANAVKDFKKLGMSLSSQGEIEALEEVSIIKTDIFENENTITEEINSGNEGRNCASEDEQELVEDLKNFKNIKKSNIKDFSSNKSKNTDSFLKVKVENKILTVKKSTLCWMFSDTSGRLSSDRLSRFKSTDKSKTKDINITKNQGKDSDSETSDSSISCILESDTESESFESGNEKALDISIKKEYYYAVYYDNNWYIGRVLDSVEENRIFKIKFLKMELDTFLWPKEEDIQNVEQQFIFYGPLKLLNNGPFCIKRADKCAIEKKYKVLKKQFSLK